jgi:hypothetical protein
MVYFWKLALDGRLFNYLNCAFWALCLPCSADKAFFNLGWKGFTVFHFVNHYRASVYACLATSAFLVNNDFYHFDIPLLVS